MLTICCGTCINGKPCTHKARFGKFCGKHVKKSAKTQDKAPTYKRECEECDECPICYDALSKPLICPNGHSVCQEHYLQHITATYDHYCNLPKGRCFVCRASFPTSSFSQEFIEKLPGVITKAQFKRANILHPPVVGQPRTIPIITAMIEVLQFINVHK